MGDLMTELDWDWLLFQARQAQSSLQQLDWGQIKEPGCYLHVSTGLLARIFAEELERERPSNPSMSSMQVAKLATDPLTAVATLRAIASRHGYSVRF
jgi:hypothetical protein